MRKVILVLLTLASLLFTQSASAVIDGPENVITIIPANHLGTTVPNRSIIPIEAYYEYSSDSVMVIFVQDIGNVATSIYNMASGEFVSVSINAYNNLISIPISGDNGHYILTFTLSTGQIYLGEFYIEL